MLAYSIRRILVAIPVLLAASVIVFTLTLFTGDPVEEKYAGRNPPVPQQTIDNEQERLHRHHRQPDRRHPLRHPRPQNPLRIAHLRRWAGMVAESQPGRVHRRSQVAKGVGSDSV